MDVDVAGALAHLDAFLEREAAGYADNQAMAKDARAASVAYTETRAIDIDTAASLAYLAYFGPRAVVAVARALRPVPASTGPIHVVDVGAGSGASALAWAFGGSTSPAPTPVQLTLVEQSPKALELARRLLQRLPAHVQVQARTGGLTTVSTINEATHISAAFVVGELPPSLDVEAALRRVAPSASTTVLVDAGDHPRARRLQTLRDTLRERDDVVIHGPCPHRDACPALQRERDWCHDRVEKRLPERLARFARLVGRDDALMSLSWLSLGRGPGAAARQGEDGLVVVGVARQEKGRVRLPVCGPRGLRFVQALNRDRAVVDAVAGLDRGDRLPAPKSVVGDTWALRAGSAAGADADANAFMAAIKDMKRHAPPTPAGASGANDAP
jgi:hypothetical protein